MRELLNILENIKTLSVPGDCNRTISKICFDSREVSDGDLFVAVRGTITDGHLYISQAVKSGAVAIVCEVLPENPDEDLCWVLVENSALALAYIARAYFDNPSSKLKLVGVTGTNGKTTIASLLYDLFNSLGYKSGLLSTVGNKIFKRSLPASHTTPDPIQLNSILSQMVDDGCDYAFMEVSSIALDQHRTDGLVYEGGIFTNLSHDHLDYHLTFDNYIAAKKSFFDQLAATSFALVNADDRRGSVMLQNTKAKSKTYALKGGADYKCKILEARFEGMLLSIDGKEVSTRFIGDFNASNLLAVYAAAMELGVDTTEALTAISSMHPVEGRLEIIRDKSGKTALVDYAHTPDALENVLDAINKIREEGESVITVVGAGGNRDKTKRPIMASIAAENSSRVVLTSDNPRDEDPEAILDDMMSGISADLKRKVLKITDRREAIKTALMLAGERDIVLVAGKGHETYQEVNGVKTHFDDREEIRKNFNCNE